MDDSRTTRPPTADLLGELRSRLRLSKQRLAELSDVSATYVRNIEAGFDESGRPVVPSANVIQRLARGLARAEPGGVERANTEKSAYAALMAAAGYLPAAPANAESQSAGPLDGEGAGMPTHADSPVRSNGREPRAASVEPEPSAALPGRGQTLVLRDRRLARHLRELLEDWEALASEDQSLLLGIAEFVAERRRRREGAN